VDDYGENESDDFDSMLRSDYEPDEEEEEDQ
jgi:hypothetical protein